MHFQLVPELTIEVGSNQLRSKRAFPDCVARTVATTKRKIEISRIARREDDPKVRKRAFDAPPACHARARAEQLVDTGPTGRGIVAAAKDNGVDLIAIGTSGEGGMKRLLGSTTNAVMHDAPCDVLSIHCA